MPECPFCKMAVSIPKKEWNYRQKYYRVKLYKCPKCGLDFCSYFHNGEFSHNIPKNPSNRFKISKYLQDHFEASENEIVKLFGLDAVEVKRILLDLQERGIVYKLS